jgi:large subunit ribosomal protein L24
MKKKFSASWKASKQKRKQRKYLYNLPHHLRHKLFSVNLSKELRKKYGKRNFPLRKGDIVKVMRGEFKNRTGKVIEINRKNLYVFVEGIQRTKKDGTKVNVPLRPHVLQIINLNLEDKKRMNALSRSKEKQSMVGQVGEQETGKAGQAGAGIGQEKEGQL